MDFKATEIYPTLTGAIEKFLITKSPSTVLWKDKSGAFVFLTPASLVLEHRSIFLGLLLNTGLLTGEKELVLLNHSSANHKAQGRMKYIQAPTTLPHNSKA